MVYNTTALNAGILNLTGGFTVYGSDLLIDNLGFMVRLQRYPIL